MKAVLDTNIFISGLHWHGVSEKILRAWFLEKFELVSSIPLIEELKKTLILFKIPLEAEDIEWWESLILEKSIIVTPIMKLNIVKDDPDDNKFIEAAVKGCAELIVSQDKHLLRIKEYQTVKIVNPNEFMILLEQQETSLYGFLEKKKINEILKDLREKKDRII